MLAILAFVAVTHWGWGDPLRVIVLLRVIRLTPSACCRAPAGSVLAAGVEARIAPNVGFGDPFDAAIDADSEVSEYLVTDFCRHNR